MDLDTRLEQLGLGRQVGQRGRLAVNGAPLFDVDGTSAIDGLAHQVENAA